ncbi:MAG: NUDIX hydrolase [Ignavibacteriaceae bacterium]
MKLATLCYVIDKKKNRTLMLHRVKKLNDVHEGKWNGLGGKLEIGETPEECVIREIKEESGLSISDPRLHGFITFPLFDGVDDWYVFVFTAENYSGEIIESAEGNLEWIPSESVTALNLWDGDAIFLKWLKGDKFFSAKFIYEKGMLKNHSVTFY